MTNPFTTRTTRGRARPAALACCLLALSAVAAARAQESKPAQVATAGGVESARGVEQYRRGAYDDAIKSLRAATKRQKADAEAWHYLGLALTKKEKFKDALKAFERAVELSPRHGDALTGLAYASLRLNREAEALQAAENVLSLDPANVEARYIVGVLRLRSNLNTAALDAAEAALRANPSYSPALYLKVLALMGLSANAVAAATDETQDVRKVLLDKTSSRLEEADAALRRFAELEPRHAELESLREQVATLRVYAGSFRATPAGRDIFSPREVTTKAQILSRPEPLYTERARRSGVTGNVTLRMVLAADGAVKHIVAVRRLPDGLTENAINAARRIKFVPATKDGRPVSQFVTIQYHFNIY